MKVFLTGASGFVGTQLISFLTHVHGDSVVALSRSANSDSKIKRAADEAPTKGWPASGAKPKVGQVQILRGDLDSKDVMIKGMEGCDVVIHAAAKVDIWGPYDSFQKITVDGTRNVVEAAKTAGVRKFIHVGTEAVLIKAKGAIGKADETTPIDPPPWAPYTRSKAAAEKIVIEANSPPEFETVSVRPRFIWGRGDTVCGPKFAEAMSDGTFRWMTPPPRTSTVHVINVCHALRLAAEAKGKGGEIYLVTDGPTQDLRDFVTKIVNAMFPDVNVPAGTVPFWVLWTLETMLESLPFLGYGTTRKPLLGRQALGIFGQDVIIDDSKIRRELHYESLVTVEEGLEDLEVTADTKSK